MRNYIFIPLLAFLIAIIQVSFFSSFKILAGINLALIGVILITIVDYRAALNWAFCSGLLLDLNSVFPLGTFALIFIFIAIIVDFLFKNYLANKSVFTLLILTLTGVLVYNLSLYFFSLVFNGLKISYFYVAVSGIYFINILKQVIVNSIFLLLVYLPLSKSKPAWR